MRVNYDGQLITASVDLIFRGKKLRIDDVILDTGSSHTIFNPDFLEVIGSVYENNDLVYEAYGIGGTVSFYTKEIDGIVIDNFEIKDIEIDVGLLPKNHKGLLGLDILKKYN